MLTSSTGLRLFKRRKVACLATTRNAIIFCLRRYRDTLALLSSPGSALGIRPSALLPFPPLLPITRESFAHGNQFPIITPVIFLRNMGAICRGLSLTTLLCYDQGFPFFAVFLSRHRTRFKVTTTMEPPRAVRNRE